MRHVAICIDADEAARPALAGARRARGRSGVPASVLHVHPPGEDHEARRSAIGELVASELPDAEAHVLQSPDPVAAILQWSEAQEPDLIVVGGRERSDASAPLGVVAQALLDGVRCSVLIARADESPRLADYVHVGACIDLSEDSLAVLEEARPLVSEERILELVHVAGGASGRREAAAGLVRALASAVRAEPVILEGDPATELLAWQRRVGADLLVAAAGRPRDPARGIGPVSASLVARAGCDVIVARCPRPTGCGEAMPPAGMIATHD